MCELNYEYNPETGLNEFYISTDEDIYFMGPYDTAKQAENAAMAAGFSCVHWDLMEIMSAMRENARKGAKV